MGRLEFIERQPARLTADLGLARELAGGRPAEPYAGPAPPYDVRVVVLDATGPGGCQLADVLTGRARPPAPGPGGRPAITRDDIGLPAPIRPARVRPRLASVPLAPEDQALSPAIRAEVLDAHAVAVVVGYRDVIAASDSPRAADTARRAGPWLPLAADVTAPGLRAVVVDGVEESNSNPASRTGWTRRRARALLALPPEWPDDGIMEISSRNALGACSPDRDDAHLGEALRDHGIAALLSRMVRPFDRDPARWLTESALRRALAAFSRADRELADRLRAQPAAGALDLARLLEPGYARQRQAWLIARGLAGSLASALAALEEAIGDLPGRDGP